MISPSLSLHPQALEAVFTRRHYAVLAAAFLAFVIYGSLVPFHYRPLAWEDALASYQQALIFHGFSSRSDLLANILLFIPLSYLLLGAISVDRPRWMGWIALPPVLAFCFLLSSAIEFTQIFFPPRCPDINDIIGESTGAAIGATFWLAFGRTITGWGRKVLSPHQRQGSLLLTGYLVFLVLYHVLPLDLTLSPTEIVHKYRDGKIQIIPYAIPPGDRFEWVEKHCWTLALFFPVGVLWAHTNAGGFTNWKSWPRVLALGFFLAGLITFLKIFVVSRHVESGDIITGTLAIFLGWVMGCQWRGRSASDRKSQGWTTALLGFWLALVIFVNWHPFDFDTNFATAIERLKNLSWLPFADYYHGSYINFLNQVVRKTLLFVPFGLLMVVLKSRERQRPEFGALQSQERQRPEFLSLLWAILAAFTVAGIVEIGQAFLPSRYPSVTDVLLETSGTGIGFFLARQALKSRIRSGSDKVGAQACHQSEPAGGKEYELNLVE